MVVGVVGFAVVYCFAAGLVVESAREELGLGHVSLLVQSFFLGLIAVCCVLVSSDVIADEFQVVSVCCAVLSSFEHAAVGVAAVDVVCLKVVVRYLLVLCVLSLDCRQ